MLNFVISSALQHPKSTGTVRLKAPDHMTYPDIDLNSFSEEDDMSVFIEGKNK